MSKKLTTFALVGIAAILAATGCEKSTPPRHADDGEIVFAAQGLNFNVQTKVTPVTELATFNVLASTGTVGASETQAWAPVAVTKDGTDYLTGKYWPLTDQSYHFYASNASLTFGATGSTVTADGSTDIVVAYLPTPSFKEKNTLTFNHIYARVGNLTLNTQSGYTLSGVSATLKDGVSGGTYNIFSGNGQTDWTGWSALGAASDRALGAFSSSTTAPVSTNDLWLVPGDYTISVTYTLNKGDYSEQFTKTGTVSLVAGKTNTITATAVGGSASEIKFGVSVTAWSNNNIALEWTGFAGLQVAPGPLYYNGTSYEIKDSWNYDSYNSVYGKAAGSTLFSIQDMGELFEKADFSPSDGDIDNLLNPLNGWRLPTKTEIENMFISTSARNGSTVNGIAGAHWTTVSYNNKQSILFFPDNKTITGATLESVDSDEYENYLSENEINEYLAQGCVVFGYNVSGGIGEYYYEENFADEMNWGSYNLKYMTSTKANSTSFYGWSIDPQNYSPGGVYSDIVNYQIDVDCIGLTYMPVILVHQ